MANTTPLCSPQVASGPLADLGYCEEVCLGDVPENPSLKTARRRSTTLALTKDSYDSEEVRSDRMVSDSRHGIRRVAGDIVTEISPGSHADFMEAVLGGYWQAPVSINLATDDIVATPNPGAGTVALVATGTLAAFRIGDTVTFAGSSNAAYDGHIFTIVDFTAPGTAVAVPSAEFDETAPATLAAGTFGMSGARVEMGNIYRSFTFERAFTDIGSFIVYTGCRVNQMAVDLPPTGIATATYSFMGHDASPIGAASIDGVDEIILTDAEVGTLAFDGTLGTITASTGSFVTAGIQPGDRVLISGDGITDVQNRNPRTVTKVTATVLTVAEAIQTGGPYTGELSITRVGLPAYTLVSDESVLVAVSGMLIGNGKPIATVTAMNFTIDNQMAGSEVVGANTIPAILYGNQCTIQGSMTVLFDRGGAGELLYNAFDFEHDDLSLMMRLDKADGSGAVGFVFPRVKVNTGAIGDAVAEGLPVSLDWRALKPKAADTTAGVSQIVITDTAVVP